MATDALWLRELRIVFRAPLTWVQAALSALLVGHGFVLAIDLYSASSRSVGANVLMARELDPLPGIVRPLLGGVYLAVALLGPLVGARSLAVERERRTLTSLLIAAGPRRVLLAKWLASWLGAALQLVAPVALLIGWMVAGGHLGLGETAVALLGHVLHLTWVVTLAFAAAALTRTFAQALAVSLMAMIASWALEAASGFAALAWLGAASDYSISAQLDGFEHGLFPLGAVGFFLLFIAACAATAAIPFFRPSTAAAAVLALLAVLVANQARAWDFTEDRRHSLPPAIVAALGNLPRPELRIELDRDDARRQQLERDFLTRLRLARPDALIAFPPDHRSATSEAEREEGYGRITVTAGAGHRETFSASRRELTTLLFEAAGAPVPSFEQPEYPGHPLVIEGWPRFTLLLVSYAGIPGALALTGWWLSRTSRRNR